jgi:hypothetical protein
MKYAGMGRGLLLILLVSLIEIFSMRASARPEYALRYNIISCTACHYSPTGGGPKNIYGKLYGAHGFSLNPSLVQDYVSADFRVIDYYPEHVSESNDGAGVMSGSVAGHLALDSAQKIHLVVEDNIAGFTKAPLRDTYALFRFAPADGQPHAFESLLVGRFRPPFGIITDEHRTYTRIQTATEWYTFETGAMLSGSPTSRLHYDFALVNGTKNAGQTFAPAEAEQTGAVANARYIFGATELGASTQYHTSTPMVSARSATSIYSIVSLDRATWGRIPASIYLEFVDAHNWDTNLGNGFANNMNYVTALGNSESQGWLAMLNYDLTRTFSLIYKFDMLTPDRDYPADYYLRHGFGFRYFVGPGVSLQMRTEWATATPPTEANSTKEGGQDATFGILQMEL